MTQERDIRERAAPSVGTRVLRDDTLVVFLSDTHIGGDPGSDIFESPDELTMLFEELAEHEGPVELVLAGDFFDFLLIEEVPKGENRASETISRPEYEELFSALRRFAARDKHRVIYLPGNHDAEMWWNAEIRKTLSEERLVNEFALSYTARFESTPNRTIYCEHGNEFDSANTITDYEDRLDTPLGDHIVTDVVRRVMPMGDSITRDLDLRDIGKVFPLVTIPEWIVGRVFYDLISRVARYLLLPLLIGYLAYRIVAYLLAVTRDGSLSLDFWDSYRTLPGVQTLFSEIAWDAALLAVVFVLFFIVIRRTATRTLSSLAPRTPGQRPDTSGTDPSVAEIRDLLNTDEHPPMRRDIRGREIDVFVSGHTHAPALSRLERGNEDEAVIVNSGCWLRQLHPVPAHFGGPPVFVSKFVQTHVRVYLDDSEVHVELWEHPKPARSRLRATERLAVLGRLPAQPAADTKPWISARDLLTAALNLSNQEALPGLSVNPTHLLTTLHRTRRIELLGRLCLRCGLLIWITRAPSFP